MSTNGSDSSGETRLQRLFPWIIFLSAFLAFAVQPMLGKALLPRFGGASSVWATGLLFFTGVLFLGYLYVFLLVRFGGGRQVAIHRAVIVLAIGMTALSLGVRWVISGDLAWGSYGSLPPQLGVLLSLSVAVGVPCFLLATTSPLVQYWWGRSFSGEPYRLYSLSNVGSLLALLAYPFLIEPRLPLQLQSASWYLLFAIYGGLYIYASLLLARSAPSGGNGGRGDRSVESAHTDGKHLAHGNGEELVRSMPLKIFVSWSGYAAIPSFLLVAVTTHITQVVAPVPLLWTVPLALYLVTFILAFRGAGGGYLSLGLLLLAAGFVFWAEAGDRTLRAELQAMSALLLLFSSGLVFHGRLYAMRPALSRLPLFFLLLSLGGVLGTLGASLLPPLLFPDLWEYPLGVAIAVGVGGALLTSFLLSSSSPRSLHLGIEAGWFLLAGYGFADAISKNPSNQLVLSRNFYGTAMVSLEGDLVVLSHGKTRHGSQFSDPERAPIPTAYYAPTSGAGRAIQYLQERGGGAPVRIGVVGLGAGTLAAYCRPGDSFVFYELDSRITSLARRYFSYLRMCPGVAVRHGDARVLLEREQDAAELGRYDLLAVDAFSDDAVPVHLLTLEAFQLYLDHLAPNGVLAVHTSNVYIELAPVVIRIAKELGWSSRVIHDWEQSTPGAAGSDWVLLARDPEVLQTGMFSTANSYIPITQAPLWTDTHSSILPLLRGYQQLSSRLGR